MYINKCAKQDMYDNLMPEFFDAKLIVCITFPDKPGEDLMQVIGFKIWQQIEYQCSS
jgi:hypothetical protein